VPVTARSALRGDANVVPIDGTLQSVFQPTFRAISLDQATVPLLSRIDFVFLLTRMLTATYQPKLCLTGQGNCPMSA
ncbi:hypothetical protein OAG82_04160, partial [Rubripirellula sp.]